MDQNIKKMQPFINGQYVESKTEKYMKVYDPSTGDVIAETPCCTMEEVEAAEEFTIKEGANMFLIAM